MDIPSISVQQLQTELASSSPPVIVDVREANELRISTLPGAIHIPMSELADRLDEIPRDADLVILCRTGNRSGRVTAFLLGQGFGKVRNIAEGINGWADQVDPSVAKY